LNEIINLTITDVVCKHTTVIWGVPPSLLHKLIFKIHIVTPIANDYHSLPGFQAVTFLSHHKEIIKND